MEQHDADAERTTLGAAMRFPRVVEDLPLAPDDFMDFRYECLFRLIRDLVREGQPVGPVNLASRIGDIKGLTPADLHAIYEMAPPWEGQAVSYARTVAGLSRGRAVRALTARLGREVDARPWDEIDPVLDSVRAELDGIVALTNGVRVRMLKDVFHDAVQDWQSPEDRKVWPTGWAELDDLLNGGWKPGQVTVLGARPAVGKSAVAACATVAAHQYGVGFFSLEMSEKELAGRMLAIQQGIDLGNIENAAFTAEDWTRIDAMKRQLRNWRVYLEALPRRSMAQIRATVRTWSRDGHIPLIVIDYLQLMTPADSREHRERQVSRLAEDCKALAKEFDCHVLVLAQVNRGSTQREDKRPTMSDLRESGGIEANADNIILLHREENPEDYEQASSIEFNLAKNRHGRIGRLNLTWRPDYSSVNSDPGGSRSYAFGQPHRSTNAHAV